MIRIAVGLTSTLLLITTVSVGLSGVASSGDGICVGIGGGKFYASPAPYEGHKP